MSALADALRAIVARHEARDAVRDSFAPIGTLADVELKAAREALAAHDAAVSTGDCTADGANVWCNGQIVATAHGFTLRSYRAARISECLNACAGIDDPVALVQAVRDAIDWIVDYVPDNVGGRDFTLANLRRTLGLENEESRGVTRQLLHWGGVPVHVTGTVTTSPGNWSLIDAALTEYHNE